MWPQKFFVLVLFALVQLPLLGTAAASADPAFAKESTRYRLGHPVASTALREGSLVWVEMDEGEFTLLAAAKLLDKSVAVTSKAKGPWVYFANKYLVLPLLMGTIATINLLFPSDGYTLTSTLPLLHAGRNLANTGTGLEKIWTTYVSTYAAEMAKFACISGIVQYWMVPQVEQVSMPLLDFWFGKVAGRTMAVAFVVDHEGREALKNLERQK